MGRCDLIKFIGGYIIDMTIRCKENSCKEIFAILILSSISWIGRIVGCKYKYISFVFEIIEETHLQLIKDNKLLNRILINRFAYITLFMLNIFRIIIY